MVDREASWLAVVADLGVQVVAPHAVELGEHRATFTAFFPQFGGPYGMVADPEWSVIEPYRALLRLAGIGYSCVDLSGATLRACAKCSLIGDGAVRRRTSQIGPSAVHRHIADWATFSQRSFVHGKRVDGKIKGFPFQNPLSQRLSKASGN